MAPRAATAASQFVLVIGGGGHEPGDVVRVADLAEGEGNRFHHGCLAVTRRRSQVGQRSPSPLGQHHRSLGPDRWVVVLPQQSGQGGADLLVTPAGAGGDGEPSHRWILVLEEPEGIVEQGLEIGFGVQGAKE